MAGEIYVYKVVCDFEGPGDTEGFDPNPISEGKLHTNLLQI